LIEQGTPVIAIALNGPLLEKMMSNISEMRARGAEVVSVISEGNDATGHEGETIIIPLASELLAPVVAAIPLQLLAYYLAVERGADVDMPKNLAKSVTVE
jgi:glucosamine--fructose-6-phosphate aminotransferase (isomerizing)